MKTYRLIIRNHERLLGYFESSTPWAQEAVQEITANLSKYSDYRFELLVAFDEKRVIESTPGGIRVLSIEPLFEPMPTNG